MRTLIAVASLALPAFAEVIHGDGQQTTQVREVSAFDAVVLESVAEVAVKVGAPQRVAVITDGNLQPHVKVTVRSGRLVIDTDKELRPKSGIRVEVAVPELKKFDIKGSGDVTIDGGRGDAELSIEGAGDLRWSGEAGRLLASIEGSGDIVLAGSAAELVVELDGSGDVNAEALKARNATVESNGAGDVRLHLEGGTLRAKVNGSGDVAWSGTATVERAVARGSGHIHRADRAAGTER